MQAGSTALSYAAQLGQTDTVKYLFENTTARAQINVKDIVSHSNSSVSILCIHWVVLLK